MTLVNEFDFFSIFLESAQIFDSYTFVHVLCGVTYMASGLFQLDMVRRFFFTLKSDQLISKFSF